MLRRNCPTCKKELIYKSTSSFKKALLRNSSCRSCNSFLKYNFDVKQGFKKPTTYWTGKKRPPMTLEQKCKLSKIFKQKYKDNPRPKRPNYIPVSPEWRKSVFERDNYTCQICKKRGGKLHPHHHLPKSKFPELANSIHNGQTLCEDCHKQTPTYGNQCSHIKREDFLIF